MPTPAPLKNAYGNSGNALKSPVPEAPPVPPPASIPAMPDAPPTGTATAAPTSAPAPAGNDGSLTADQLMGHQDQMSAEQLMGMQDSVEGAPTVPTETFGEKSARTGSAWQTAKEQVGDTWARFQASFGVTDKEKESKLKQIYGDNNVRSKDGKFQIRRDGEKGFRAFDPEGASTAWEVMNDVADFGRDAAEMVPAIGARLAMAKGGAKGETGEAPPVPSLKKGMATGAAEGAAEAVIGLKFGDYIAQNLMGIPRDPARGSQLEEAGVVGGIGAGIGSVFGLASGAIARRRIANELKTSSLTTKDVLQTAKDIEEAAQNLADNGINMKSGKMVLSPGQTAGDLMPEARSLDHQLSDTGGVRDFFVEQGKLVQSGWDRLRQGISNVTGKPAEEIFQAAKGTAKITREVEGTTIGNFRDMAMKASDGKALPMQRTMQATPQFFGEMGFSVGKDGKLSKPSFEELNQMFPDANQAVLGKFSSLISDLEGSMRKNNGALPLEEVDRIYGGFRDTIDRFKGTKSGDDVANALIKVKDALRDDWTEHIGQTLAEKQPGALDAYKQSMQKYADIMSAQKTLGNVLKKNDLSAQSFANQIFSPSQGKDRVAQMRVLIQDTDPKLWNQLVDQQLELMQSRSVNPNTGRTNWGKLSGEINKLDNAEILDQMMSPEQKKLTTDFFKIAEKVDSEFKFKEGEPVPSGVVNNVKNLLVAASGKVSALAQLGASGNLTKNIISGMGKDKALVKWLNGEGLELVIKGMPQKQQGFIRSTLMPIIRAGAETETPISITNRIMKGTGVLAPDASAEDQ